MNGTGSLLILFQYNENLYLPLMPQWGKILKGIGMKITLFKEYIFKWIIYITHVDSDGVIGVKVRHAEFEKAQKYKKGGNV